MPESPRTTDRSEDGSSTTRRQYLRAAGALGAVSLAGTAVLDAPAEHVARHELNGQRPKGAATGGREDFLWITDQVLENDRLRSNVFALAGRHDLAVVIQIRSANFDAKETLFRRALSEATATGLDVWIRVGVLTDVTAQSFAADPDARSAHLNRLREVCRVYDDLTEDGRVVLWEEAPVMGQWVEGGAWTHEAVEKMLEHGPRLFEEQRRVVDDETSGREVGVFVHFPYVVDSKSPDVFATLADRIDDRGASPDFALVDFYRGWYEKDAGPETADDAVRSLVENAGAELDGRPVFYLGQAHTVNPGHTPSKQAIRSNLRASLEAGAAGLGWYGRTRYVPTEEGFDPFVPNDPGATFDGSPVGTVTVARDRFLYAWLSTLATRPGFDPDDRFDLWLRGEDLSFHGHRVSARTGGDWEFLCDVDGYLDGTYPYGGGPAGDVVIVRGLRRDGWLDGETLDLRIETADDARETILREALAMPCDPDAYVAEHEAASLLAGDVRVERFALGVTGESVSLVPGEIHRLNVPIVRSDPPSLHGLRNPDSLGAIRDLQELEARRAFDPRDRFDLWVHGGGLSDPRDTPSLLDRTGAGRSPAEASVVALGSDSVALFYGLERDRFLSDGLSLADDGGDGIAIGGGYAMPYAGSANFRTPARAATLLAEQPGEVETFSLASEDDE